MCGRYYIDDSTGREIEKIVRQVSERLAQMRKSGDVVPTQGALVIIGRNEEFAEELFVWGFPGIQKKGVIFNARSETALEKRMFSESVRKRRCVIPAAKFYEWDSDKNKVTFMREDGKVLYLAGFYGDFEGEERFVILTAEADEFVKDVHNRMPLILEEDELRDWIFDGEKAREMLRPKKIPLKKSGGYVQQTLDLW